MIEYRLNGPASQERIRIRLMAALRENRFPQSILIDGPVGIGKKLVRMRKFYQFGLNKTGWNKYSYISVEFDNQIICKKKAKK